MENVSFCQGADCILVTTCWDEGNKERARRATDTGRDTRPGPRNHGRYYIGEGLWVHVYSITLEGGDCEYSVTLGGLWILTNTGGTEHSIKMD